MYPSLTTQPRSARLTSSCYVPRLSRCRGRTHIPALAYGPPHPGRNHPKWRHRAARAFGDYWPEHVAPGVCRQWVKIVEPGLIMDLGGPRMFEVSTIDDSPNTLVNELRKACRKGGLTSPDVENITTTLWVRMCSVVPPRSLWCSTRRLLRRPPWPLPRCLRSVYRRNCSGGPRSQRQDRRRLRREEPHIPCWAGSRVNNLLPARHPCWAPQRIRCSGRSCPPIG